MRYHASEARLWERQALIKARPVAGDPAFAARLEEAIARHVYEGPALEPARVAEELLAMRGRIEKEVAAPESRFYDIKAGRGGILDVEFATQFLQLCAMPALADPRTATRIEQLFRRIGAEAK